MKKLLLATGIFAPNIGGPASYTKTIGEKLARAYTVTVITYSSVWRHAPDASMPFRVVRVWSKWPWPLRHLLYTVKMLLLSRQHDFILAMNAVNAGPIAVLASRFLKKPYVVKIVGDRAWESAIQKGSTNLLINDFQKVPKKGWIGIIHRMQVRTALSAQRVIVPSQYLAGIVEGWGINRNKIQVIYNGSAFKPADITKEEARKQIGVTGNILVSVGRMAPWKGFRMLIKIMPQLLNVNQFFRLVIVGNGPEMPVLQSMVRNLNLDRKVSLVGKKTPQELAIYLAAADLFVLNTGYEGFSHQVLEAMVAGVPVITTAVGGNREIIHQGDNGFLVKYNDEFNLVEAIKTLWNMPDLREKFIQEGYETVQEFSQERMERETIELIQDFL
jgi:glycosyltransferase involved in cell wall biosynthesis